MSLEVEVIQRKEYVEAIVSGEFDLQDAVDKFQIIIITCKIAGLSKVLIDFRKLQGDILALQKIICSFQVIEQVKVYFASKSRDMQFAYLGKAPQVSSYKPGLELAEMEGIQAIVTVDINEAFEWLGVKGNKVIQIGTDEFKGTGIQILSKDETRLIGIGVAADGGGSGLLIADKMGRARFGLGMDKGVPSIALTDENGEKIIALGGDEKGYGLVIMDGNEVERAGIGYKEGSTGIAIYDDKGQYIRGMVNEASGIHYSSYVNGNGKEVFLD